MAVLALPGRGETRLARASFGAVCHAGAMRDYIRPYETKPRGTLLTRLWLELLSLLLA